MTKIGIPDGVKKIGEKLDAAGFQTYLVGGCVRDFLLYILGLDLWAGPKDWDIATDAKPEEIQKIFPDSVYENKFGTVAVKIPEEHPASKTEIVEITTFRLEGKYTDKRHPDEIKFANTIEEDLRRRDFTINAMAMKVNDKFDLVDPYNGQKDLKIKLIRTVGDPQERFSEDALRLMRAVRFAVQLDFKIEEKTAAAVKSQAKLLAVIAKERIRDEFEKILMTPRASEGIQMLEDLDLLRFIFPELREGIDCGQNKHHIYTVFEHNVRALDYAAKKNYPLVIRLAALLHDVGKPRTKQGDGPDSTFYNHEVVGAKMAVKMLDRLRFSKELIEKVVHLVRFHLFYYNVGEVTESGVRRFLNRVGPEHVPDLLKVREADRIGSGVPKAFPYKLRHLLFMIEKVKYDPLSPKMLKVDGEDVMGILKIKPGPKVGQILSILLEEVLDEPEKNTRERLELRIKNLEELDNQELDELAKKAREKKNEFESGVEEEMKRKYYVK